MAIKVANLDDHLAPILVVLAVALGHAGVHRLVGWSVSLRVGLRDVVTCSSRSYAQLQAQARGAG
eukprot:5021778-Pleurochrysis_carterae.AAC.1